MKLSAELILQQLQNKGLNVKRLGRNSSGLVFNPPFFYELGQEPQSNNIYLTTPDGLPQLPPDKQDILFICAGASVPGEWQNPGCDLLVIDNPLELPQLLNLLQNIFAIYNEWDNTLRALLEQKVDLGQLLLHGSRVFGNPIYVNNKNMQLLGATGYCEDRDPPWVLYECGNIPIGLLDRVNTQYKKYRGTKTPYLHDDDGYELIYSVNIFHHDEFRACISLSSLCRQINDADYALFEHFAQYIEQALSSQMLTSRASFLSAKVCLLALLDNAAYEDIELVNALSEISFISNDSRLSWVCLVVSAKVGEDLAVHEYVVSSLYELLPTCICFSYGGEIIILMQLDDDNVPLQTAIEKLSQVFSGSGFDIGISDRFAEIRNIRVAYDKARYASKLAQLVGGKDEAHYFSQYALAYMLLHAKGQFMLGDILPNGLFKLIEHDQTSTVSYVETLRCYLDNQQNIAQTARQLYLHRSSLLQRLEKIFALLGTRLETTDDLLYYSILLRLLEYKNN